MYKKLLPFSDERPGGRTVINEALYFFHAPPGSQRAKITNTNTTAMHPTAKIENNGAVYCSCCSLIAWQRRSACVNGPTHVGGTTYL